MEKPKAEKRPGAGLDRLFRRVLFPLSVISFQLCVAAAATIENAEKAGTWRLANDTLRIEVDAMRGGRISSLRVLSPGKEPVETVYSDGGFALDHFWEQAWPGEFLDAAYTVEETTARAGEAAVTLARVATGKWGNTPPEPMSDLVLTKRISLADGKPWVTVDITVANPTGKTKMFGFWAQQCFTPAGEKDSVSYFRPSNVGVSAPREDAKMLGTTAADEVCYVKQPVAGWTATLDPAARAGVVFLMDYDDMSWLYNCVGMNTTEWMYERVVLPPGKQWATQYAIRPATGMVSVAHASRNVIVAISPEEKPDAVALEFSLARGTADVVKGSLGGEVRNLITGEKVAIPPMQFGPLSDAPVSRVFTRPGPLQHPILVCQTLDLELADGTKVQDRFEWFYGGKLGFSGQNLRLDLLPIYVIPAPSKQRRYIKPDLIAKAPHEGLNLLCVQGMFFDHCGIDKAAGLLKAKVTESEPYGGLLSEGLLNFPLSYDDLLQLDVIVLADVSAGAIDDNTAERIKDFVEAGGGLVVFGGPWSLGKGRFAGTKIGGLLPVETVGTADLRVAPALIEGRGRAYPAYNVVIQEVKPKPGAETRLTCGEYPALVVWKVGKGRVAVVALTPMGEPAAGQTPWWEWPQWPDELAKTLAWAAGSEGE